MFNDCFGEIPFVEVQSHDNNSPSTHPMSVTNKKLAKIDSINISAKTEKQRNKTLMASSILQQHQLYILFSELVKIKHSSRNVRNKTPKNLIALVCWLSIYLGKSITELKALKLGTGITNDGIECIGDDLFFKFRIKSNVKKINLDREENCKLKVPEYWKPYILSIHNSTLTNETSLIPTKYSEDIEKSVNSFMLNLSRRNDTSITTGALSCLLVSRFGLNTKIDLTAFDFAFCNESHNTRVKRYYTRF